MEKINKEDIEIHIGYKGDTNKSLAILADKINEIIDYIIIKELAQ